ncbi:hypothetical protein DN594_08020 [Enterobacter cloacae]|uniref:Uncharacterized protein n=1 Tax=Salmonella enterica TaxID=28901 RepID=A0A5T9Q074_SALER|nr:hypothetical protein [Salmonella enterica]EBO0847917.1 hypothetical protein [Salmonella enterica]EBW1438381.1 hypothetical protein [Salmonella enterica subsp. enterica serovar Mbandaka]ECT9828720.1 hypothetical protein [Salmonella enterica subsp. enterica serovar Oranienburg]RWS61058.1 hypothetical protein DN594_08020 [Enterobacter cloacae]
MEVMRKPVMLIPERCLADSDAEHVQALRRTLRKADRQREQNRQAQAMAAPDYSWSASRRR